MLPSTIVRTGITHLICDAGGLDSDLAPLHELIAWRDRQVR